MDGVSHARSGGADRSLPAAEPGEQHCGANGSSQPGLGAERRSVSAKSEPIVVYDENDYSGTVNPLPANTVWPTQFLNRVIFTVETNSEYVRGGIHSNIFYNSFSLLKSLEAGFRLQCLNHACDPDVQVMSDLFGEGR
jgi:hypothetical protein